MKISILTLFPNMFEGFLNESIIKRAIENKKVEIDIINFREYSKLNNSQVDDTPYGGGAGMVLMCQPIFDCIDNIKTNKSKVIMLTPEGKTFTQTDAKKFSKEDHLILLCGHYEGFDERIKSIVDYEVSMGDFILTGGEIPAMAITDSVVRLVDGVINKESLTSESFENELLDFPNYTKPSIFKGMKVPDVLLSGNHQKIEEWRKNERIKKTIEKRKDLLNKNNSIKIIKKNNFKQYELTDLEGYLFNPKNKSIKSLNIVDLEIIKKVLKKRIEKDIKKVGNAIKLMIKSNVTEISDCDMMINELNRLAKKFDIKYKHFFNELEYFDVIKEIYFWNMQILSKKILIENKN